MGCSLVSEGFLSEKDSELIVDVLGFTLDSGCCTINNTIVLMDPGSRRKGQGWALIY